METRVTNSISFNTNVKTTEFDGRQSSVAARHEQGSAPLLPSGTSVTEELKSVFPFQSVEQDLLDFIESACQNPVLRSSQDFQRGLRDLAERLRKRKKGRDGEESGQGGKREGKGGDDVNEDAAEVLEQLLEDKLLLDWYRAMLLEN